MLKADLIHHPPGNGLRRVHITGSQRQLGGTVHRNGGDAAAVNAYQTAGQLLVNVIEDSCSDFDGVSQLSLLKLDMGASEAVDVKLQLGHSGGIFPLEFLGKAGVGGAGGNEKAGAL